eukprot:symbB.v1.2.030761.t2/scaffold3502.1/size55238/2
MASVVSSQVERSSWSILKQKDLGLQVDQHHYTKAARTGRTSWRSTFNLLDKAENEGIQVDVPFINVAISKAPWTSSLHLFEQMDSQELRCSAVSLGAAVKGTTQRSWRQAIDLWTRAKEAQLARSIITANSLVNAIAREGRWQSCMHFCQEMPQENLEVDIITMGSILPFDVPWHVVSLALETMSFTGLQSHLGLFQTHLTSMARGSKVTWLRPMAVLAQLRSAGLQLDEISISSVSTGGSTGSMPWRYAFTLSERLRVGTLRVDSVATSSSLAALASSPSGLGVWRSCLAFTPYDSMDVKDVTVVVQSGRPDWQSSLQLFYETRSRAIFPDQLLYQALATTCSYSNAWQHASTLHTAPWSTALQLSLECPQHRVEPSFIWYKSIAAAGHWRDAVEDLPSAGAVAALSTQRHWQKALKALELPGLSTSSSSLEVLVFNACIVSNKSKGWEKARSILTALKLKGLEADVVSCYFITRPDILHQWAVDT